MKIVVLMMENYLQELFANQQYDKNNFFLIAGPCVIEGEQMAIEIAETVAAICKKYQIPYVFKASYKKANRTSASSFTGIGDKIAL
ncbi:MAG TPA: 3-deoxy-8-phosphooctulonate synthase, partial [Chitinophagaceae bacterium]|nr:3-deoxy-8-phosphooctulonate synthase [Chitinophagaceae bacterium]